MSSLNSFTHDNEANPALLVCSTVQNPEQALLISSRSCSCGCQTLKECHMQEDPDRGSGALHKLRPAFASGDISV